MTGSGWDYGSVLCIFTIKTLNLLYKYCIIIATVLVKTFSFISFSEQVSAFNASYSDSGLFGVYTISQAAVAGDVSIPLLRQESVPHHKLFNKVKAVFFVVKIKLIKGVDVISVLPGD